MREMQEGIILTIELDGFVRLELRVALNRSASFSSGDATFKV